VLFVLTGRPPLSNGVDRPASAVGIKNAELTTLAYEVLGYINDGNYYELSRIAHPEFGIVFSPSATVTLATNKRFRAEQIAAFGSDNAVCVWGIHEGSGEPIEMTPGNYFAEYILARDYISASIIGVNHVVKSGNALENITEVFPDVQFVDFHIPGAEKGSAEDFGWTSLRLGFEEHGGRLWLTLILNSKWTV